MDFYISESADQYLSMPREGEILSNGCSLDICGVTTNTNTKSPSSRHSGYRLGR